MITVALPKGRTLQATLDRFARAGLSTLVLERREMVGGSCS